MGLKPLLAARLLLLAAAVIALATGIAGGLARLGAGVPATGAAFHGALMASGFLGTVISLERAIALGHRFAYAAPLVAALGTVALLLGRPHEAAALWIVASLALLAASVAIARRQLALHTVVLAVAALAWLWGNVAHAWGRWEAAPAAWFAFLVLTIGAERLEMTRLARRPRYAAPLFMAIVAALLAGVALGSPVFGIALVALAAWLVAYDIARHTVRLGGFARHAAIALLAGYAWLVVGGVAWILAPAHRDLALHALGLGFVFSMIMAHAPVIVPVVARARMRFTPAFYAPLALLHASLLARALAVDPGPLRLAGALGNAAAIALFVATLAWALATTPRSSCQAAAIAGP